jgi:integrase
LSSKQTYFNFINSLNSPATKRQYAYCLDQFLIYTKLDLNKFLKLPQDKQTDIIINYLVTKKVSKGLKHVIFHTLKHACEVNDVLLNWKKIKKFVHPTKTGNEIAGRDRGYELEEIRQILDFCDQRAKTIFLILASTGIRIGALGSLKIGDLEKIDDLYKVRVYSGDKEQYYTFTTPECAKEIDTYLKFRKRRGEIITPESYLIIKRFSKYLKQFSGLPFKGESLRALLQTCITNSGLRQTSDNPYKRKEIPLLHGFRKWFSTQLVEADLKTELRWMLEGHNLKANDPAYVRTTEKNLLKEYYKAVPLLTISNEERLKFKLEERIHIDKTQIESLKADFEKFKNEVLKQKKK